MEDGSASRTRANWEFSESRRLGTGSVTPLRARRPSPEPGPICCYPACSACTAGRRDSQRSPFSAPSRALLVRPRGEATALIRNARECVELRQVRTGDHGGNRWLIREGLNDGDQFDHRRLQFDQAGAEVKAVPAENVQSLRPTAGQEGIKNLPRFFIDRPIFFAWVIAC